MSLLARDDGKGMMLPVTGEVVALPAAGHPRWRRGGLAATKAGMVYPIVATAPAHRLIRTSTHSVA